MGSELKAWCVSVLSTNATAEELLSFINTQPWHGALVLLSAVSGFCIWSVKGEAPWINSEYGVISSPFVCGLGWLCSGAHPRAVQGNVPWIDR